MYWLGNVQKYDTDVVIYDRRVSLVRLATGAQSYNKHSTDVHTIKKGAIAIKS